MLLNCFACYVQSDWPKKVISVMITSIYIYNVCDPLCFFSSNLPCHNLAVKGTGERCDFNQIAGNIAYLIVMSYSILNLICGVMVSMLASSMVDRGFKPKLNIICGVMVSMLASSMVDRGFKPKLNLICGVMVSMLASSMVDRVFKPKTVKLVFVSSLLRMQH